LINLAVLTQRQHELDSKVGAKPDDDQLLCAINAEIGEVTNAAKQGWIWWRRPDLKTYERKELLGELIDLLHFLLVGYNGVNKQVNEYHQALIDELHSAPPQEVRPALAEYPVKIMQASLKKRFHEAISYWVLLAKAFDFNPEEIDVAFYVSIRKNLSRWEANAEQK